MTSISKPPGRNKPSIKYSGRRVERACFEVEVGDLNDKCCAPSASDNCRENGRKSEPKSSEILSTAELVSAVGQIWDCASRPLAFLQPRTKFRYNVGDFPEANAFRYSSGEGVVKSFASSESQDLPDNSITNGHFPPMVQEGLEFLRVSDKILSFRQQRWNFVDSLFSDLSHCSSNISGELQKEKSPTTSGMSYNLRNIYGWMSEPSDRELEQPVKSTLVENQKVGECCVAGDRDSTSSCNLNCTPSTANNLTIESADYTLQRTEATGNVLWTSSSRLNEENTIQYVASDSRVFEECQLNDEDDHLYVDKRSQKHAFVMTEKTETLICSPTHSKMNYGFAKQEHAFAGALAGLSVSVCLHPVDTVKTVIQSCRADQRSINYIRRSIISERGVTGLYRGIASNIASSAPISAVYTFTYESVKGALLPFFPAEYRSLAHCTAGGCASIATSFIFTPSERIKQQMQVGLHYQNCWKAGVGIIRMGGLSSLYAGWGAVLCRNVPHSIIKFYTYESLKHLMSSSRELNAHPDTSQTLICGGLAGSIAALFTTPFDVVKTRFQTQIPGSIHQYDGVFRTLINIGKHEGLKGLYRGLIPRLVMYVSQGAIFFASYESFKRLFSLEGP